MSRVLVSGELVRPDVCIVDGVVRDLWGLLWN